LPFRHPLRLVALDLAGGWDGDGDGRLYIFFIFGVEFGQERKPSILKDVFVGESVGVVGVEVGDEVLPRVRASDRVLLVLRWRIHCSEIMRL
jgi:hypothetical protein